MYKASENQKARHLPLDENARVTLIDRFLIHNKPEILKHCLNKLEGILFLKIQF